jgi:uncharacterized protein YebE (UPF0316 family)
MNYELYDLPMFTYVILPFIIFLCRIIDVSMGTLRFIFISKGYRMGSTILGFFEILIWITVIGEIMSKANNIFCYLGYAAGFATGNYIGIWLENKLSLGFVVVRIITQKDSEELLSYFKRQNYGVTTSEAVGATGKVKIIFTIIKRRNLKNIVENINYFNPKAFYTVEDVRSVSEGVFPKNEVGFIKPRIFSNFRKGK